MSEKNLRSGKHRDARFLKSSEKKKHKGKWIWILVLLLFCFAVTGIFQGNAQLKRAKALKVNIVEYGQNLLMQNSDGAKSALDAANTSALEIQESLNNPFWKIAEAVPFLGKNVTTARSAVGLLDEAFQKLLAPAIDRICQDPTTAPQLADTAQRCFEFAITVLPDVRQIVSSARELDLGLFDVGGKLSSLLTMADKLINSMESQSDTVLMPLVQHMQKYPFSELGVKKLLDYQCLYGYVKSLDQCIPLVRDVAAELQSSELMGGHNQYLNAFVDMLDVLEDVCAELLYPLCDQLRTHPVSSVILEEGYDAEALADYIAFVREAMPHAEQILEDVQELELDILTENETVAHTLLVCNNLMAFYHQNEDMLDTVLTPLVQHMQKYPISEFGVKKLLDYQCLYGYVKSLDQCIPLVRDVAAELQSSEVMGGHNQYLNAFVDMLDVLEDVCAELLYPLCDQLRTHPVSSVILEGGYDAEALADYIAFVREAMPHAEQILEDVQELELDILTENETVAHTLLVCNNLMAFYHQNEDMLDFAEILLSEGEDRLYLLAAQNSAEIRASGGFPGAMGVLRIKDGVITIGDFAGVNDVLAAYASRAANISFVENILFKGEINVCRDACYCPDFERVASIWALGYEMKNNEKLDGVLSLTPALIQKVLGPTDEILLSDGTKLTSENATRILQHDLYFQYFLNGADVTKANKAVDALFMETAKKAISTIVSGLNVQKILSYPDVIREGFDNRTLMVWMRDEEEQAFVRELGWSGNLNADPNAPEAGIYFSNVLASKMGWFIEIYPEVGDPEENEDGSLTYPVTVRFHNTITKEQVKEISSKYILGGDGRIRGLIHFFAPAGGTIGSFKVEGSSMMPEESKYKGLPLGYVRKVDILPESFVEYTFEVTTAPGVQVPLELSMTPTLQNYK